MTRTLYIHVGPIKTGTSAIQSVLSKHDNSIVIYPKVGLHGPGSHHDLVFNFYRKHRRTIPSKIGIEQQFGDVAACIQGNNLNVVISSEMLVFRTPSGDVAKDLSAFIRALISYLGSTPPEVEIIFSCREHFARAASVYSQRVKGASLGEPRTPDDFLRGYLDKLLYAPFARSLQKTGYKVTALNYHPSHDWVARFVAYLGFPREQIPAAETKNQSLSTKALIASHVATNILRSRSDKGRFSQCLKMQMADYCGPSQFIFGPEAAQDAEKLFSEDRSLVRDEFGVELPVPDLRAQKNMFFLNPNDVPDIAAAARAFGADGETIVDIAQEYLRP